MTEEAPSRFWYRVKFLALVGVFLAPFVGGWLALYVFEIRPESMNYGTLVHPLKKISWPDVESHRGEVLTEEIDRRWAFVLFAGADCLQQCQKNVYFMRQIKALLARDVDRLKNVLVLSGPMSSDLKALLEEYPNFLVIEQKPNSSFADQFQIPEIDQVGAKAHSYLVDPDRNLMMFYEPEYDEYRVLEDIKKLMKVSQIG